MKALVTGGAGFIGSNLVDSLIELGHEVVVIDNMSANNETFYWNKKASNYKHSICNYKKVRPLFEGVDFVFHLAAESRLQPAIENPINAINLNCVGTCTVLQCAREAGVKKVIYSSTSSGYGNNPSPNVETQMDDCLNPYSVSKIAGEKMCRMYSDLYGLKTIIFRYFNVYGNRAPKRGQYSPVIGIFQRQKADGEPLTIVGDGSQRRDFINVEDIVYANIKAAFSDVDDSFYGQVYNVGSGKNYSIMDIANCISNEHIHIEKRKGEVETTMADISKIKLVFGWEPKIDLMQILNKS